MYGALYEQYLPLMRKIANKYKEHTDEILQEMFFAILKAVNAYKTEEVRKKYNFEQIMFQKIKDVPRRYFRKYVDFFQWSEEKKPKKLHLEFSSDNDTDGENNMYNYLKSNVNVEQQVIDAETEERKAAATLELWGFIEQTNQLTDYQRTAIIKRFKDDISYAEQDRQQGKKENTIKKSAEEGYRKLRANSQIINIAKVFEIGASYYYSGGFCFWKKHGMSVVEFALLRAEEKERKKYLLRDKELFDTIQDVFDFSDKTGVHRKTLRKIYDGGEILLSTAEKIAAYFNKPIEEVFVKIVR